MGKVNEVLKAELPSVLRCFMAGYLTCCCTLGCSMLPGFYLKAKVRLFANYEVGSLSRTVAESYSLCVCFVLAAGVLWGEQTVDKVKGILEVENERMYHKVGLNLFFELRLPFGPF